MPIKVNDIKITDEEVFQEMQYQTDADNVETVIFKSAQALVVQQLLLQEIGIEAGDKGEEEKINKLLESNLKVPDSNKEACKQYYKSNEKKFFDKMSDQQLPFEMVEVYIKEYLQNQSTTSGISEYIKMLAENAKIKGFDFKDPTILNVIIK